MTVPTLVFDLDGTLVDTAPDLLGTLDAILAEAGHGPVPAELARPHVGVGARAMLAAGLAHHGAAADAATVEPLYRRYLAHYEANIAVRSRPFEKLVDLLDAAQAEGWRLAVCTNKQERLARLLLDALGLSPRFHAIAGGDTYGASKPDPRPLLRVIADAGGSPEKAVLFGDSEVDVATARAAGVPIIGIAFGYSRRPMEELSPDLLVAHYGDVTLEGIRRLIEAARPAA